MEYKGGHLAEQRKELHKEDVAKLWAAGSGGKCVFVRVVDRDWAKLEAALNAIEARRAKNRLAWRCGIFAAGFSKARLARLLGPGWAATNLRSAIS